MGAFTDVSIDDEHRADIGCVILRVRVGRYHLTDVVGDAGVEQTRKIRPRADLTGRLLWFGAERTTYRQMTPGGESPLP